MKPYFGLLIFAFSFLSCHAQTSEAVNGIDNTVFIDDGSIGNKIYELCKYFPNETQLSFAILKEGTERYVDVKRVRDTLIVIEHKPYTYEIGSITKVFTSTLLAQAVTEGEVTLTEAINTRYNASFLDEVEIPFVNLANHTSGLPRLPSNLFGAEGFEMNNPYKIYDKPALDSYLAEKLKFDTAIGSKYAYSNLGAGLLGQTLA